MDLTTKQTAYLRGLGQALRPILHVGYEGYTPAIQAALEDLFRRRELVKVRVLNTASDSTQGVADAMAKAAGAAVAGVVGKTFVLYRPNPELKDRIELPEPGPAADEPEPRRTAGRPRTKGR
jgi:RNA-binding protein